MRGTGIGSFVKESMSGSQQRPSAILAGERGQAGSALEARGLGDGVKRVGGSCVTNSLV